MAILMMGQGIGISFSTCITSSVITVALQSIYVGSKNSFPMIGRAISFALLGFDRAQDGEEGGAYAWTDDAVQHLSPPSPAWGEG